ncbi:MAG: hypothetical protein GXZ01_04375 [Clostridiaceae bacterium]|nr:hypothetical protein [Clostridiaceae bacterium]
MHYWSEAVGTPVFINRNRIGHIENIMIDPAKKTVVGFILERKNTEIRHRFFRFTQIEEMKRDSVQLINGSEIKMLPRDYRKNTLLAEDLLSKLLADEKGKWIGRVADFAFSASNGTIRELIISKSLVEDLWLGRKRMPVLSNVEFSQQLIRIDRDTKEEITGLQKGLKKWFNMDSI